MTLVADSQDFSSEDMIDVDPFTLATQRCDSLIDWYNKTKRQHRLLHQFFRSTAIILGGLTPVLVLIQAMANEDVTKNTLTILIALFPSIAAIITGFDGLFQWKDNYIRMAQTAEALKSERIKFLTRTTRRYAKDKDDDKALDNFVSNVERIVLQERTDWVALVEQSMDLDELIKTARSDMAQDQD